jgi:chemotaxis protein MotA
LFNSLRVIVRKALGAEQDYLRAIEDIVEIANVYRTDPKGVTKFLKADTHPFMKDAVQLMSEYGFGSDELDSVLTNALKGQKKRDHEEVKVWHTVSRFPPAFGLMGATLGMISFLRARDGNSPSSHILRFGLRKLTTNSFGGKTR